MVETVTFNGVKFRRYPDSGHRADRVYFTPGIADKQRGVGRLHEEVWKQAHGPVPDGHDIHHRDGDPLNNDIGNLVCLTRSEHTQEHLPYYVERLREHADRIRPLAKVWHASPEGREWHRQHGLRVAAGREAADHVCEQCGSTFATIPKSSNRFCSNRCKSAWRRASGLDDEQRACVICGDAFTVNKYSKVKTCSRACGGKAQGATKRGLQHQS